MTLSGETKNSGSKTQEEHPSSSTEPLPVEENVKFQAENLVAYAMFAHQHTKQWI